MRPQSRAVIVRAKVRYVDGGKVTKRFEEAAKRVLKRHGRAFKELAK